MRALDREVRATLEQRIKALVAAQAESFGVTAQIDWQPGYAVLVNTPAETAFAREVALELVGAEQVTLQGPPLTGSEDFAFMLERVPGSYLLIGNGDGDRAKAAAWCTTRATTSTTTTSPSAAPTGCCWPNAFWSEPAASAVEERRLRAPFSLGGLTNHTRSRMTAMPCPTPMHMVHSA